MTTFLQVFVILGWLGVGLYAGRQLAPGVYAWSRAKSCYHGGNGLRAGYGQGPAVFAIFLSILLGPASMLLVLCLWNVRAAVPQISRLEREQAIAAETRMLDKQERNIRRRQQAIDHDEYILGIQKHLKP